MSVKAVLTRLANALRTLMGEEIPLTLDEMGNQAEDACRYVSLQLGQIDDLTRKVNSLPNKSSAALENCTVSVDVAGLYTFASWDYVVGGRAVHMAFETNDFSSATTWKKDSLLTLYAPGNRGADVTGNVSILDTSSDRTAIAFEILGPGTITLRT